MNLLTLQGKVVPSSVRHKTTESWLEGKGAWAITNRKKDALKRDPFIPVDLLKS